MFDAYALAEALAAQTMRFQQLAVDLSALNSPHADTLAQIVTTAAATLTAGGNALQAGDTETAMFALGAAQGGLHLVACLLSGADDALVREMTRPFEVQK